MVVKLDLTPAQSRDLFWFIRSELRRGQRTAGPLSRALETLHDELEAKLATEE